MTDSWANIGGLDLHVDLDRGGRRLRASLEDALRSAVRDGRLPAGTTLPPSRALAVDLGIARNTVAEAYAQLVAEGWLVTRQGSATRVADRPRRVSRAQDQRLAAPPTDRYDLRAGFPDVTSFPRAEWLAAARAALADAPDAALGYGPPGGEPGVRAALAGYLGRARGVHTEPDAVIVCAGFTAGLRTLAAVLRSRGVRRVGVERYGYLRHRQVLEDAGLQLVPLDIDDEGAVADDLRGAGAVLLTAAHQFPLGMPLSATRRAAFVRWAVRTDAVVIEDDYDGEFRYDRRALGAVQALAPEHVVYAGTASKTLAPGLRLGWLAVPARLRDALLAAQALGHGQAGVVEQLTLARFLLSGRYDRHVRRMRLVYQQRRARLVSGLARRAPGLALGGMAAGLHATLALSAGVEEAEVVSRAHARDLMLQGLSNFAADGEVERRGLVIGYATPPPRSYTTALARLLATLAE